MESERIIKTYINGKEVRIKFSDTESEGLKGRIRDILTNSFEERFFDSVEKLQSQK